MRGPSRRSYQLTALQTLQNALHICPAPIHASRSMPAQVDAYAAEKKLQVVGVYHASERLDDAALSPVAARIAEKLQQRCCPQSAVFIVRHFRASSIS